MPQRWHSFAEPAHDLEARALRYVAGLLPDEDPHAGWSNFTFTTRDGAMYEVDALVLTPAGLFLVEVKSYTGSLVAGPQWWEYTSPGGRVRVDENPRILANAKAKKLGALIRGAWDTAGGRPPFVEALVYLSETEIDVRFEDRGELGLAFHTAKSGLARVDHALLRGDTPGLRAASPPLDGRYLRALTRALDRIGLRPRSRNPRIGHWALGELVDDGPRHQDYVADKGGVTRRVRLFTSPEARDAEARAALLAGAQREFRLLSSLNHPHILRVNDLIEDARGPALVFDHPDGFERLDAFIARNHAVLSAVDRVDIVREVALAVQYAHRQGVVHRAITPACVLIDRRFPNGRLDVRVMDWHLAAPDDSQDPGTRHIDAWQGEARRYFLAPEALRDPSGCGEATDVYGLGALLAFALTAEPPAADLADLERRWSDERGLRLSARHDGIHPALDSLVHEATAVDPAMRPASVANFCDSLEQARQKVLLPVDREPSVLEAGPGDMVSDRFLVERRLGKGSTAVALLVTDGEREPRDGSVVLKIALSPEAGAYLEAEAAALRRVDSKHVVRLYDELVVDPGGLRALVLQSAGTETLRHVLRTQRQLSLDDLNRFGDDLCTLLVDLEAAGVLHRDIKPENLGLDAPDKVRKRLIAFDFSLAGAPLDAVRAGTPGYVDPFAGDKRRGRHDAYNDRYAAAVTLHEMASGRRPFWGRVECDPLQVEDAPLRLHDTLFPAPVRDRLRSFFERALARELRDRFDNADDMRAAWRDVFATTRHGEVDADASELEARLAGLTPVDPVARLGLSESALDALDRAGVRTIEGFVSFPRLNFIEGSGEVRRELRDAPYQVWSFPTDCLWSLRWSQQQGAFSSVRQSHPVERWHMQRRNQVQSTRPRDPWRHDRDHRLLQLVSRAGPIPRGYRQLRRLPPARARATASPRTSP